MDYQKGTWDSAGGIEGLGWLAVALVIFASWRPLRTIWGAYLFGMLSWMYFYISGLTRSSQELFKMLPYIATLAVLIFVASQHKVENHHEHQKSHGRDCQCRKHRGDHGSSQQGPSACPHEQRC